MRRRYHPPVPTVHDQAICINHWEWSETSQTVALFTRSHGVVRALAKGSRRPKAPYSGGLESLTLGTAGLIFKPSTELALLTDWDLLATYPGLRATLPALHNAMYIAELVGLMVRDHDPHPDLFDRLRSTLNAISTGQDPALVCLTFQWHILEQAGFAPVLDRDIQTGNPLPTAETYRFDASLGGLTADHDNAPGWRVRAATINHLKLVVQTDRFDQHNKNHATQRASRLLAAYIRTVLGREPRTHRFVFHTNHEQTGVHSPE